jgi:ABC-type transport system substrate-binding protein
VNGRDRAGGTLLVLTATVATLAALVSGCTTPGSAEPAESPTADAGGSPSAEATDPAEAPRPQPTLDPDGSALQNLDYFDAVNERLIEDQDAPDGRAFIDSLVNAGFDRGAMEVTPDRTAVDLAADNIQFSVRMGEKCLLGQFGNTGYVSVVGDVLSTGKCLVGRTRPIDW